MYSKNGGGDSLRHTATTQPRDIPNSISTACKQCMHYYQALCDILQDITPEDANQYGFDRQPSLATTQDARMRFKAWAVNIAALHGEHLPSSLDFRLKDTTEIRQRILKVLKNLEESLVSAISIANGTEPNETWESGAISDSEDGGTNPLEEVTMTSDLDELFTAIKTSNSSLMKISMVIRSSPARDDYLKAASRYRFDPRYDIGHVKEKHGSARRSSGWLLERLGKAITRRRQYLKYREEHHSKLSRQWAEVPDPEIVDDKPDDVKPDKTIALTKYTKATTFIENMVKSHSKAAPRDGSEMGGSFGSQTSYEATIAGETAEIRLTVPPHPQMAFEGVPFEFGEPFQCPYCYTEQTVKNRAAWKKHVFRDLKPYVCTFRKCDLRMFKSRNEWFAHEIQAHRREWTCPLCEVKPFTTSTLFENHLAEMHHLNGTQLEALVLQSEEPVDKISASACHLCDEWETDLLDSKHDSKRMFLNDGKMVEPYASLKQFRRHLGRHMEQLALFSLPMNEGEEMEDDSANNDEEEDDSDSQDDLEEPGKLSAEDDIRSRPTSPIPVVVQPEGTPYANKYHEEPYNLKCICDYEEDDGHTIQCTTCKTWQHMLCYFSPSDDLSWANSHVCVVCSPRPMDRNDANQRQRMSEGRRQGKGLVDSGGASATNTKLAPTEAWGVSPEDEAKFGKVFDSLDTGNKGYITIEQCAEVFASSNIPGNILSRIWELASIAADMHLSRDEFAIAMYYIVLCQNQPIPDPQSLPDHLPPHMVPTSMRHEKDSSSSTRRTDPLMINIENDPNLALALRMSGGREMARIVEKARARLKSGLNANVATFKERGEQLEINSAKSQDETEWEMDENELQKEREETNNLFELHSSLSHFIETRLGLGMSHADWKREMTAAGYDWTGGIRNQVGEMELAYFREEIQDLRSDLDEDLRRRGRKQSLESILELLKGNEGIGGTSNERTERRRRHRLLGPDVKIRTLQNYARQWDNEERAADGPPTQDILTKNPSKVTTMLYGKTLDVTGIELDADFLESLPEDIREELIVQAVADRRIRAAQSNTKVPTNYQELFDNLSKANQNDILEQLEEQGYINAKSDYTPETAQFPLPIQGSTRVVDASRASLSEDECRKKLTTYEAHTIRKIPPLDPKKERPSWARSEITRESLSPEEVAKQVRRLNENGLSVWDKMQTLQQFQQKPLENLLKEMNASDVDGNFEYSLAQLDSKMRSLHNGQRETTVITAYFKRAPLKDVSAVVVYQALERTKAERMAALTRPPPSQVRIHSSIDVERDNGGSLQEEGLEQLSKPIESDSDVEFEDVATRSLVAWWKCCSCLREVDPIIWEYDCPDCSHPYCSFCSVVAADHSQTHSSTNDEKLDQDIEATRRSRVEYAANLPSDPVNIRYQGKRYILRFASGSIEDGSLLLEDVRTKAAATLGIPKEQSWNLSFTHMGHLNPFNDRTPWRDLKLKRYAELEFFLLPNTSVGDAVSHEVGTGVGSAVLDAKLSTQPVPLDARVPQPTDTRPPEEVYADQLRQLEDIGFLGFDQNIEALKRSGGCVQDAIADLRR